MKEVFHGEILIDIKYEFSYTYLLSSAKHKAEKDYLKTDELK